MLGYSVLAAGNPLLGGAILGVACSLKYSIGLPFLLLALVSRQWRFALAGVAVFAIANGIGVSYAWLHGTSPVDVVQSLFGGVARVGGYEQSGFQEWFSGTDPHRFQLMNLLPLLNSFGIDRITANAICMVALGVGLVTALFCAVWRRPPFLAAAAVFSPFFLLCTYHRFYDSAIITFPLLLAWLNQSEESRVYRWGVILASCTLFLSFSNTLQTRAPAGLIAFDSWWWNYLVGPHHVYALALLAVAITVVAVRYTKVRQFGDNSDAGEQWP